MEKIRFAVVGCGAIGGLHAEIISGIRDTELAAVSDVNERAGAAAALKYGCLYVPDYGELLNMRDIDAVALCVPSGLHGDMAIRAAYAGKHIICEKPIETDVAKAEKLVGICSECGVRLSVIMQHRFDPAAELLRRAADEGDLGEILWGSARTIWYRDKDYYDKNTWKGTKTLDGCGALINQSIHYIDLLLYMTGDVKSVSGKCAARLHKGIETEDAGAACIAFRSGAIGTVEGTTAAYPGLYSELSIYGERGTVIIRNDELFYYKFDHKTAADFESLLNPYAVYTKNKDAKVDLTSHARQYRDFIDSIRENRRPRVTGEEAVKVLKLIKAIYKSSESAEEIYL